MLEFGRKISDINVPKDMILIFNLTLLGVSSGFSSVLRFTNNPIKNNAGKGTRMPGIFLGPSTTWLHIQTDAMDGSYTNFGPKTQFLPLNVMQQIIIEMKGLEMSLYFDGIFSSNFTFPSPVMIGNASLYCGDLFYPSANATITYIAVAT